MRWGVLAAFLLFQLARAETVLILGDSLSSGYGIDPAKGWVALLEARLKETPFRVVNASRSGETTFGGRARLPGLLERYRPEVVILELGGNDGLRGFPPARIEENLAAMAALAREEGAEVVVVEVDLPRNYGAPYRERFRAIFDRLCQQVRCVRSWLMPEILEPGMLQPDGIHPTEELQPLLFAKIWRVLKPLIEKGRATPPPPSRNEPPLPDRPPGAAP